MFRGGKIFRQSTFSGYFLSVYIPSYKPSEESGFQILFYNANDEKIGKLGSDSFGHLVQSVSFELNENGCGGVEIQLVDEPPIEIDYRTRVDIYPFFSSDPWYTGFIYDIPAKSARDKARRFRGFGYFDQLDWVLVTGNWAEKYVHEIIADIISTQVITKTQIKYNALKIANSLIRLSSYSIERSSAKEAISKLLEFEPNYVFGVDNFREFFFKGRSNSILRKIWVGVHADDCQIEENASNIITRCYVKAGKIADGSNILAVVENQEAIEKYGIREAVITAPEIFSEEDAALYGQIALEVLAKKKISGRLMNVELGGTPIIPDGLISIVDENGEEHTLRVVKANYQISSAGITANCELEAYE